MERVRLQQHQELLESRIRLNWVELRDSLRPGNIAREALYKVIDYRTVRNLLVNTSILKGSLNYGLSILVKKFAGKAVQKLGSYFKK